MAGRNVQTRQLPLKEKHSKFQQTYLKIMHFCNFSLILPNFSFIILTFSLFRKKYKYVARQRVIPTLTRTIRMDTTEEVKVKKEK